MRKPLWILAFLMVGGCASQHAGENVTATVNPDDVKGCRSLGLVTGAATNVLGSGQEHTIDDMKAKAAELGGDTLLVGNVATARYTQGTGQAYECAHRSTPTPAP
jgi:hypothetical protein